MTMISETTEGQRSCRDSFINGHDWFNSKLPLGKALDAVLTRLSFRIPDKWEDLFSAFVSLGSAIRRLDERLAKLEQSRIK